MFLAIFFHFFLGSGSARGWTEPNFQVQVQPLAKPNWTVASVDTPSYNVSHTDSTQRKLLLTRFILPLALDTVSGDQVPWVLYPKPRIPSRSEQNLVGMVGIW